MKLEKGDIVRCVNDLNDVVGVVVLASKNGESVIVLLPEVQCMRMRDGAMAISSILYLSIDYKSETVFDIFGSAWEVYVCDTKTSQRDDRQEIN